MTAYYVNPNRLSSSSMDATDWANASDSLHDVLDASTSGDVIHVQAGTIKIHDENTLTIPAGVTLYGGYPNDNNTAPDTTEDGLDGSGMTVRNLYAHRTIIDGQLNRRCIEDMGSGSVMDGFEFINARSTSAGGAVYLSGKSGINFTNCAFRNCAVSAGSGGAIAAVAVSNLIITQCEFGLCYSVSKGGAIYTTANTTMVAKWTRFYGNYSDHGGAIYSLDAPKIIRCLCTHNSAINGNGGFIETSANTVIEGSTIYDNYATGDGGGIDAQSYTIYIYNSVIRGNEAGGSGDQYNAGGSTVQEYSNVEDGATGTDGNIDVDPDFRAYGVHPYEPESATGNCDSADSDTTYFESIDIRGNYGYADPDTADTGTGAGGSYYDMGCYEYRGIESDYLNYTRFILDMYGVSAWTGYGAYYCYAIIQLPKLPTAWSDNPGSRNPCKVEAMTEIRLFETDTELTDWMNVGGESVFNRSEYSASIADSDPNWTHDMPTNQTGDEDYIARQNGYPETNPCKLFDEGGNHGDKPEYAIVEYIVRFSKDDEDDNLHFYNLYLRPIIDDEDGKTDNTFKVAIHSETYTDRFCADMPASSYLVKEVVMKSLLSILYESRSPITVPLFGFYKYDPIMV